jgi:hypothetical protein
LTGFETVSFWLRIYWNNIGMIAVEPPDPPYTPPLQQIPMDFNFELRNGGSLTDKTAGTYIRQTVAYDHGAATLPEGWLREGNYIKVVLPISDFVDAGLNITNVDGFAFEATKPTPPEGLNNNEMRISLFYVVVE